MKAEELRKGNHINTFINTTEGRLHTKAVVRALHLNTCEVEGGSTTEYNFLEPIRLSKEWLEGFGFEKYNECFYKIQIKRGYSDGWYLSKGGDLTKSISEFYVRLRYVHELQNFWFTLTGRELVLK